MSDLLRSALDGERIRNAHALVVDGIGRGIVRGDYPPDSLLPGDEALAGIFGVSRTVLREAMKTLAAKGMIEPRSRVGTRVRCHREWNLFDQQVLRWHLDEKLELDFLGQLYEMRLSFEPYSAGLAAERATPEEIAVMHAQCAAMAQARDEKEFAFADLELHRTVQDAAGNAFLYSVGTLIEAALLTSFRLSSPAQDAQMKERSAGRHRDIVAAIEARDRVGAENLMRDVIAEGWSRISSLAAEAPALRADLPGGGR